MEFKGTKGKIHAVEYAGVIFIQDTEFYEDQEQCNILNMDYVGREVAEANGKIFECAREMFEMLGDIQGALTMQEDPNFQKLINEIYELRVKATTI